MTRFDRYIVTQLLTYFGFFALILVSVYWINRAVILFDQLVANGYSGLVFLEFTSLNLPNVIRIVLPIAGFAAVVWGVNRLNADSELVVIQATGYSPWRLARSVLAYGIILFVLLSVLTHWLVPASLAELAKREAEISADSTNRFLREGVFMHPAPGFTFFVTRITGDGLLEEVFLDDARAGTTPTTYTARRAVLVSNGAQKQLVMLGGLAQSLGEDGKALSTTRFDDLVFDISDFLGRANAPRLKPTELTSLQILRADPALLNLTRSSDYEVALQIHERIAQCLLAPAAALIGFATLLVGGFSRFGLWRQISVAVALLVVVKGIDNSAIVAARADEGLAALVYLGPLTGFVLSGFLLMLAGRPAPFSRRTARGVAP